MRYLYFLMVVAFSFAHGEPTEMSPISPAELIPRVRSSEGGVYSGELGRINSKREVQNELIEAKYVHNVAVGNIKTQSILYGMNERLFKHKAISHDDFDKSKLEYAKSILAADFRKSRITSLEAEIAVYELKKEKDESQESFEAKEAEAFVTLWKARAQCARNLLALAECEVKYWDVQLRRLEGLYAKSAIAEREVILCRSTKRNADYAVVYAAEFLQQQEAFVAAAIEEAKAKKGD